MFGTIRKNHSSVYTLLKMCQKIKCFNMGKHFGAVLGFGPLFIWEKGPILGEKHENMANRAWGTVWGAVSQSKCVDVPKYGCLGKIQGGDHVFV